MESSTTKAPTVHVDSGQIAATKHGMPFALLVEKDGEVHVRAFFGCVDDALAYAMRMNIDMDGSTYHVYSMNTRQVILTVWPINQEKEV